MLDVNGKLRPNGNISFKKDRGGIVTLLNIDAFKDYIKLNLSIQNFGFDEISIILFEIKKRNNKNMNEYLKK